ncbi:MAG: tetratricopeptide repeat protein [Planctomycetota bacterium]|nr:tetratricopeptide repeat protein [Planctomycetota bacterium]
MTSDITSSESKNAAMPISWISGPWFDLLFFVATPIVIVPLISAARVRWSIEAIALFVAAFGATGHHLPGLLRAYGDRELFQRFRLRFVLAPLFLFSVCTFYSYWHLRGLVLIGVTWGTWHSLMQVYGFLRIYDGKVKSIDRTTSRLDFLMCLSWFLAGFLNSPGRLQGWLDMFYTSGGFPLTEQMLDRLALITNSITAVVTVAFLINWLRRWQNGHPANPLKIVSMVVSFAFWWYAMILVDNPMLGVALFEIFHDVQYLAIVWIFNRGRVNKSEQVGSFTAFLFRKSGTMAGLYLALVVGYGIVGLAPDMTNSESIKPAIYGFLLASGLLHFYYDGFIWKVREHSTRRALNLADDASQSNRTAVIPMWMRHGSKWAFFVLPAAWLGWSQLQNPLSRMEQLENIVVAVPDSWNAHYLLAIELRNEDRLVECIDELERAVRLNPGMPSLHLELGESYRRNQELFPAQKQFQIALKLDPENVAALAGFCEVLLDQKKFSQAEKPLQELVSREPENAEVHHMLGSALSQLGQFDKAASHFEISLRIGPETAIAHNNLGLMRMKQGKRDDSLVEFEAALQLNPEYAEAYNNAGVVYVQKRMFDKAIEHYRKAVDLDPQHPFARNSLAWNLSTCEDDSLRNGVEALALAEQLAAESGTKDPGFLVTLSAAYAETGQFDKAKSVANDALKLSAAMNNRELSQLIVSCLTAYAENKPYREVNRNTPTDMQ